MKIYDEEKFIKYLNKPVRIKLMFPNIVAIAEGALLATFECCKYLEFRYRWWLERKSNNYGY